MEDKMHGRCWENDVNSMGSPKKVQGRDMGKAQALLSLLRRSTPAKRFPPRERLGDLVISNRKVCWLMARLNTRINRVTSLSEEFVPILEETASFLTIPSFAIQFARMCLISTTLIIWPLRLYSDAFVSRNLPPESPGH